MSKQEMLSKIIAALMDQDRTETNALVDKALENGVTPMEVLNEGLAAGLQELGVLFAEEEVFLPELLLAAEITTDIMKRLALLN